MTRISPLHADDRFALMDRRRRILRWQDRASRVLVASSVIALGALLGYLFGISVTTAEMMPRILAEAACRSAG